MRSRPTPPSAVHDHLDYLDKLATDGDLRSRAAPAGTEITRLTSAWRSLLDATDSTSTVAAGGARAGFASASAPAPSGPPHTNT
ncbi:hypothetical protein GCM10022243_01220 [Saccharothrix violaceirubra]|uniref:Uncharacterized protein n=1 Tax=Saccharothrix violaceirubra TaxID=413306 RepID=A0A7W7T342_9PSEU|nr:hypothetical protein [Saccharothrix violaceirubra]MBB4965381.1 hypothetical protein [Saccharothrix violaceirubra]